MDAAELDSHVGGCTTKAKLTRHSALTMRSNRRIGFAWGSVKGTRNWVAATATGPSLLRSETVILLNEGVGEVARSPTIIAAFGLFGFRTRLSSQRPPTTSAMRSSLVAAFDEIYSVNGALVKSNTIQK